MVNKEIKFKNPYKTTDEFIDIIAPTFGLKGGLKATFKARSKLSKKEEVRKCLIDVLKLLAVEYKK